MSLKSFNADTADVWLANIQIVVSLLVLCGYPFLSLERQILVMGIVTMITWTGTAFAHRSAAKGKLEIKIQGSDD